MIVEDEAITAMSMSEALEAAGHRVLGIASTYEQVQRMLQKQVPDLAIVDIHLSGSAADGVTIAREITAHYPLPIVYLTAHSEPQTYQATKDTRPAAYLLKPFEPAELIMQIKAAYERFQARRGHLPTDAQPLLLPIVKGHRKVDPTEIVYVMAAGVHVDMYITTQKKPLFISTSLGRLVDYLPTPNFYRLSRSLLINLDHLDRIEQNQLYMVTQAKPLALSDAKRQELLRQLTVVRTR